MKKIKKSLSTLRIMVFLCLITSIFSSKCDGFIPNDNPEKKTILEVISLDENVARVFDDKENDVAYVYVLETQVSSKNTFNINPNNMRSIEVTNDILKDIFTVTVKDAKSGLVFPHDFSKASSVDSFSIEIAMFTQDHSANIPILTEKINGKDLMGISVINAWIDRGFEGNVEEKDIAFLCLSSFTDITNYLFQKLRDEYTATPQLFSTYEYKQTLQKFNLKGAETSTCSIATNNNDKDAFKGWVKTAKKSDIELFFLGIDFGDAKLDDLFSLAPSLLNNNPQTEKSGKTKNPGINSKEIVNISKEFPYATKKVIVSIVENFPPKTNKPKKRKKH